jgi:nucleoside-diphosphate-sugar epimerase
VKQPPGPYCRSEADSELVARRFQGLEAPVVSVLPAAVWGPHNPHLGEGVNLASNVLRNRYPIVMPGGMHIVDVRYVAGVLPALMQPGRGPRSYLVAGRYVTMPELIRTLAELTGRRIRFVTLPAWVPCRVRPHGGCHTTSTEDATALECRGHLDHELRRPLRRLKDPRRVPRRAPPATGHARRHRVLAGRGGHLTGREAGSPRVADSPNLLRTQKGASSPLLARTPAQRIHE